MSTEVLPQQPSAKKTKIPIRSPAPLRRSNSLRVTGDKHAPEIRTRPFYSVVGTDGVDCAGGSVATCRMNRMPPPAARCEHEGGLQHRRGKSFMEWGEHGNGDGKGSCCNGTGGVHEHSRNGDLKGPNSPYNNPRIRSMSLSLSSTSSSKLTVPQSPSVATSPRTPPTSPSDQKHRARNPDWDSESVTSGISGISLASSTCDHASVARNGTTFSGRSMKYVFHCSQHAGATGEDYLTPTQRAHRQVRRLKSLLQQAQKDLEQKDSDIVKLTKEVVELRLYKAALSSPEERSASSDAVTVRENQVDEIGDLPDGMTITNHVSNEMTSSYTDSGHYDDYTNSSVHSKDSVILCEDFNLSPYKRSRHVDCADKATTADLIPSLEIEHHQLIDDYEKRINDLIKSHESESHELKEKHNDKVEELLQRIAEINKRYWELVPDLDNAKEHIKELESQLEEAMKKLEEQEEKNKATYLQMYAQGREAEKMEREQKVLELAHSVPTRISVPELLHQLQVTQSELDNIKDVEYASTSNSLQPLLSAKEAVTLWVLGARKAMYKQVMEAKNKKIDPEITLQFLKSAIYYFLTDKENNQGHLRAIQSILGFTPSEIANIERARSS